jgi:hypothetical protein
LRALVSLLSLCQHPTAAGHSAVSCHSPHRGILGKNLSKRSNITIA